MNKTLPQRLTNQRYIKTGQLRIFHQFEAAPIGVHWHEFYELSLILAGEGSHVFNGVHSELGPGSIFLLTPADFHGLTPRPGAVFEIYNLIFSEDFLEEDLRHLLFENPHLYLTDFSETVLARAVESFRRIEEELTQERPGHRLVVRGELTALLVEMARSCPVVVAESQPESTPGYPDQEFAHPAIRKAITIIQHHFRDDISLPDIAGRVRLNPNYFSERFKDITGTSFQRYVVNLRLDFAASLLRISQLPVTEICYACGFKTLSHFERIFKLKFNQTPHAYRRGSNAADSSKKELAAS